MENLGIVREVAAVTCGQDVPLFEVREGVFDKNHAKVLTKIARKLSIYAAWKAKNNVKKSNTT